MNVRKTASPVTSSSTSTSSSSSRTRKSASTEDWDADDEGAMSNDDAHSRHPSPLMTATSGPYCPRRPTLREILANSSPAPWTLTAFMAYLSNNHCLETLEFTMDAGRYKKHYAKMMSRPMADGLPAVKDREYVQALWQRLVDAYIKPDGSREVNLPSDVRDPILHQPVSDLPPSPEALEAAVAKVYELMEDSVLVPFLNSAWPMSARSIVSTYSSMPADDTMSVASDSTYHSNSSRTIGRSTSPSHHDTQTTFQSLSQRAAGSRRSAPSPVGPVPYSPGTSSRSRFSARQPASTSSPSQQLYRSSIAELGSEISLTGTGVERIPAMMDDSGSGNSPTYESPATPPTSPPVSDAASSPKRDSGMWKKLGRLGTMKSGRKRSQAGLREE